MKNEVTISSTPDLQAFPLESKRMDLEAGMIGRFFGTGSAAPTSIAGLTVTILLAAGVAIMFIETKFPAKEYWTIAAPIITLALGYVFGRKT